MRVCFFGTYERQYPRNAMMVAALEAAGVMVYECHEPAWERHRDKSGMYRGMAALTMLIHLVVAYFRLVSRYLRMPKHDVVIVGYIGQFDMAIAYILTRLRSVPLVFNPLVSLYDTFCDDRDLVRPGSVKGRLLWFADHLSCRLADLVLVDTKQHAEYFSGTFRLSPSKFRVIPVGADDRFFVPQPQTHPAHAVCEVLFVGKLIPLHGCETILQAAAILRDQPLRFTLVGSGQQSRKVQQLVRELNLTNVRLIDWVEYDQLPSCYAQADICLGIFGESAKAARVIPNKVFQAMAMKRPVLTAASDAVQSELDSNNEVRVCRQADAEDLARQIMVLAGDEVLRAHLAENAFEAFKNRYSLRAISTLICSVLAELVPGFDPNDRMSWGAQPEFFGPRHRFRETYLVRAVQTYVAGRKVLDAACGAGSLAHRLAAKGYSVTGVDLSANFLDYLQMQRLTAGITLVRGDVTQVPYQSSQLDGVVAGEVLEHLQDDVAAVRECWRVLRPGGVLIVSVPADPKQWDWLDQWAGHVRRYTARDMRQLLEEQGFTVIRIHSFGFPFVRLFHRYVYMPHFRASRVNKGRATPLSTRGWRKQLASYILLSIFQLDRLFDRSPWGMGLIAVAQKGTTH